MKPKHIAFIMDGNGRWAKRRLLPRNMGHREGAKALERMVDACEKQGFEAVTFFVFSTENWKRPQKEVDFLFDMVLDFAENRLKDYAKRNLRTFVIGDKDGLPQNVRAALEKIENDAEKNTGMRVCLAINYGGRDEILRAIQNLSANKLEPSKENFEKMLDTAGMPDPDIIVRSSGEERLSNFLLWQAAYSEFVFLPEAWPEFNAQTLKKIMDIYETRERRFGDIRTTANNKMPGDKE